MPDGENDLPETRRSPRVEARSVLRQLAPDAGPQRLRDLPDDPVLPELKLGADRYAIHEVLGEGGMGRVYLARDEDLRRPVALKVATHGDRRSLARFVGEAQIMGQLQHPGIVPVHELGIADGDRLYYTMPVVRGATLADVIQRLRADEHGAAREWTLTRLAQVFIQICHAIGFAHAKGVIHRDIKPGNVMVGRHGEVQVLDWGLAKVVGRPSVDLHDPRGLTEQGMVTGTPAYMSPEQALGEAADERSDVYALGALLYEMLTLRPAFSGTATEILARVVREEPPPPRSVAGQRSVPDALERACLKALSKRPAARHEVAGQLAAEVQAWLESETDRSRRRELADERVEEARGLLGEHARICAEISRISARIETLAGQMQPWMSVEEKRELHAAEDERERLGDALARVASAIVAELTAALGHELDHAGARGLLADFYFARLLEAESEGRHRDARFCEQLVAAYHDGRHAQDLDGSGTLELASDPPGAEAWLHRLEERDLVLVPDGGRLLGTTPLGPLNIPRGSWLVILRSPGRCDTRVPVLIERCSSWSARVRLHAHDTIGDGVVHVPGGPFISGADPEARSGDPRRVVRDVPDFLIAVNPVTLGEYILFLDDLADAEGIDAARARAPRTVSDRPETTFLLDGPAGRLVLPGRDAQGDEWIPGKPVFGINWLDATAYCEWLARKTGLPWRLPTSAEHEKAARGVDGRFFPWGHRFDASLCNVAGSRRDRMDLVSVDEPTSDVSIYGVRGMAGNVRDWTSTEVVEGEGASARRSVVVRGGNWASTPTLARCAAFSRNARENLDTGSGFRLARDAPWSRAAMT